MEALGPSAFARKTCNVAVRAWVEIDLVAREAGEGMRIAQANAVVPALEVATSMGDTQTGMPVVVAPF